MIEKYIFYDALAEAKKEDCRFHAESRIKDLLKENVRLKRENNFLQQLLNCEKTFFPNAAHLELINHQLEIELTLAGIPIVDGYETTGEVKTHITGKLYDWEFLRAWIYWVAFSKKGLPRAIADKLFITDKSIRVDGDCRHISPQDEFTKLYHIDTPLGLKALADAIKEANK